MSLRFWITKNLLGRQNEGLEKNTLKYMANKECKQMLINAIIRELGWDSWPNRIQMGILEMSNLEIMQNMMNIRGYKQSLPAPIPILRRWFRAKWLANKC